MESSEDSSFVSDHEMEEANNVSLAKNKALDEELSRAGDGDGNCCCSNYERNDVAVNESKLTMREEQQEQEEQDDGIEQLGASALVNENVERTANASPLEKLIQKQRLELTMELRRLQFGERPVSNTESKNRLEEFFTSALNTEAAQSTRNPAQFRSDVTRSEIESLGAQRRVSNVLSTARQALENTLQRYVVDTAARRRPQQAAAAVINIPAAAVVAPIPPVAQNYLQPSNLAQSAAYANGLQTSQNSVHSNVSSNIVIQSTDGSTNVFQPVTAWIPVVANNQPPAAQVQQQQPVEAQAPWLARPENLFNAIENVRRQQIIDEISELVHHQLVTHSLESAFRTRLEQRVLQQLQNTGTDGERTRNFVRNISQTNHVERNDFSHLGIFDNAGRNDMDNLDSASTYQSVHQPQAAAAGAGATARQSTIHNREIRTLQNEINELKNMMKLSFELQLDMQRSLRQEISALIAGNLANKNNNNNNNESNSRANRTQQQRQQQQRQQPQQQRVQQAQASVLTSNQPSNEGNCLICTEGKVDTVFYKCGHMCTCYTCSMRLKQTSGNCPVCRAPIVDILRAYKCNLD